MKNNSINIKRLQDLHEVIEVLNDYDESEYVTVTPTTNENVEHASDLLFELSKLNRRRKEIIDSLMSIK